MTVGEFIERAKGREDYELTVKKHDKWQLSCNTTVPVESASPGLDWTHGQFIIYPSVDLVTSVDEISMALHDKVADYSHRLTRHLSIAAQIAMLLKEIPDEGLRNRIHDLLKEIR